MFRSISYWMIIYQQVFKDIELVFDNQLIILVFLNINLTSYSNSVPSGLKGYRLKQSSMIYFLVY